MVQAGAVVGVADIHARAPAHGFEPAQHLDRLFVVGRILAVGGAVAVWSSSAIARLRAGTRRVFDCSSANWAKRIGCGDIRHVVLVRSFQSSGESSGNVPIAYR